MRVSDLYADAPLRGRPVYIVGSGPSLDPWPDSALEGETAILLNDVCQDRPTWGPVAFANNVKFIKRSRCPYNVVKGRLVPPKEKKRPGRYATDNHVPWDSPDYYVFSYRSPQQGDAWDHFDDEALWAEPDFYWNEPGGSVSIFALQFALLAGATRIRMVGCDCSEAVSKYHVSKERRRQGRQVKHNYRAYWRGLMRMFREARERFGVVVTSENPWPGYGNEAQSHKEMVGW